MFKGVALTTIDNPFDPFKDFHKWFLFDLEKGYRTTERLARLAKTSNELTDYENNLEIESAIDDLIRLDFMKIYKKVYEE